MRKLFRWIKYTILFAILIFIFIGVISYVFFKPESQSPDITQATYAIQTYSNDAMRFPSRIYLAKEIEYAKDGTPVIKDYWSYNGESWQHHRYYNFLWWHSGTKDFPVDEYGNIDITRRLGQ